MDVERTWRSLNSVQRMILIVAARLLQEGYKVKLGPKKWVAPLTPSGEEGR